MCAGSLWCLPEGESPHYYQVRPHGYHHTSLHVHTYVRTNSSLVMALVLYAPSVQYVHVCTYVCMRLCGFCVGHTVDLCTIHTVCCSTYSELPAHIHTVYL